jgi:pimeloyl-ACP methyl ester carboxylesterase
MSSCLLPDLVASSVRPAALVLIESNLIAADATWSREIARHSEEEFPLWLDRIRKASMLIMQGQLTGEHQMDELMHWSSGFREVDPHALRVIATNVIKRSDSYLISESLASLSLPTIYLTGDKSTGLNFSHDLLASLGIPIIEIPNAAHYPMIDNPKDTWHHISLLN